MRAALARWPAPTGRCSGKSAARIDVKQGRAPSAVSLTWQCQQLLHNRLPFRGETMAQLHGRILKGSHEHFDKAVGGKVRTLIKSVLAVEAAKRPAARDVVDSLEAIYAPPDC